VTRVGVALLASLACGNVHLVATPSARQEATSGQTPLFQRSGVPLSQLLSDPRAQGPVVVVMKAEHTSPDLVSPGPKQRQLEWMTSIVPIVFIVHVDRITPKLTPHQDWIVADVSATVESVVKQRAADSLATGGTVAFVQDGGELTVAGRRVNAVLPYADSYVVGGRYLIFADRWSDGNLNVYAPTNYLIDSDGRLRSLARNGPWPISENGVPLSEAISRIASVKTPIWRMSRASARPWYRRV
jgi:hypothetical protein